MAVPAHTDVVAVDELTDAQEAADVVAELRAAGIPDDEIGVDVAGARPGELRDEDFSRAWRIGVVVGMPLLFGVVTIISLLAGVGISESLQLAAWPMIVGGAFFTGVVVLIVRFGQVAEGPASHPVAGAAAASVLVAGEHAAEAQEVFAAHAHHHRAA